MALHEVFALIAQSKQKDREMLIESIQPLLAAITPEIQKQLERKIKVDMPKIPKPEVKVDVKPTPVQFNFSTIVQELRKLAERIPSVEKTNLNGILNALMPLEKLGKNNKSNPLAVRMSDGKKYIDLVGQINEKLESISDSNQQVVAFGGGPREVNIDPNTNVHTQDGGFATIGDGRQTVTTGGTAVQLSTSNVPCKRVVITAETNNTGVITVGSSTVVAAEGTRRGTPLYTAQAATFYTDNLNKLYIDATVDTEGVTYVYYV